MWLPFSKDILMSFLTGINFNMLLIINIFNLVKMFMPCTPTIHPSPEQGILVCSINSRRWRTHESPIRRLSRGIPGESHAKSASERANTKNNKEAIVRGSNQQRDKYIIVGMIITCGYCKEAGHNGKGWKKKREHEAQVE